MMTMMMTCDVTMHVQLYRFPRYDVRRSVLLWKIRFVRRRKRLGPRLSIGQTFDAVPTYLGGSLDLFVVKGKCSVAYSASIPRKYANGLAQRVEVRVATVVHPCRVKSFREAVSSAVM